MLLVLWDIDGTLVDGAGHGRHAFDDAYRAVTGREPAGQVQMAGRTDRMIAMSMLDGDDTAVTPMLAELERALAEREERIRAEGRALPGAEAALQALASREGTVQSLLTGNLAANAALKLGAFGLQRWLDLEVGGYGSDPHERRSDLVAVARDRAAAKYSPAVDTVLVGDTPLDVSAAHEAGARAVAVASGPYGVDELRAAGADSVLPGLADTAQVLAAVTRAT
ncbi:MAG: haloacid dehalogenase-like hydrolase [Thermoleophilaceae bacterium]|nr:haloacid dehalogenase-like hydrolase [Thermoleophilaceae bacterium]